MIFATWIERNYRWCLHVPKDSFWGARAPEYGDEVTAIRRNGTASQEYLGDLEEETMGGWIFERDCDPFGAADYDYDSIWGDQGGPW